MLNFVPAKASRYDGYGYGYGYGPAAQAEVKTPVGV
ncbi:hypothetical protein HD595_005298 [Nonomuraea roseoviolacea subsp. carminata]|uniref:Uncharacterized protein n=1 Tax=Nonomuraea roseoviolacea subsp. carminata TaxID=160689 RepID=A0ABT1K6X8_9ACTN|nr:hypothetical protein [Nonomuraea roseoviolacea subsp. carminata]